jgi:hypothetical protein
MLVKIAGVPGYFGTFAGTYDDSGTHGSDTVQPVLVGNSISPGKLDLDRNCITPTTITLTLQNTADLEQAFARRAAGQYLEAGIADDDVSATIYDNSSYQAGDVVQIGSEAVELSGVTSTDQIDFTPASSQRGVLGTRADAHPAGTVVGSTPRTWIGREVVVVLGAWDGAEWVWQDPYRTMHVTKSPAFEDGHWKLSLSDEVGDIEAYRGFRETRVSKTAPASTGAIPTPRAGQHLAIYLDDVQAVLEPDDTSVQGFGLLLKSGSSSAAFSILAGVAASGYVLVHSASTDLLRADGVTLAGWLESLGIDPGAATVPPPVDITARAVYPMRSGFGGDNNVADIVLRLMLSDLGDGAVSATYDVLPGQAATATREQVRAGFGLPAARVDVASWVSAGEGALPSCGFVDGASGVERLGDFLSADACPMLGGYWYVNRSGAIAFKRWEAATAASTATYTLDNHTSLGSDNVLDDETAIVASVVIHSAWDYAEGKHRRKHIINMAATLHLYKDTARTVEIKSRLAGDSESSVLSLMDQYTARFGDGVQVLNVVAPWGAHTIDPGDTLLLTNTRIPAGDGTSGGLSGIFVEVIGIDPDFENGEVRMTVARRPEAKLISPCCEIDTDEGGGEYTAHVVYGAGDLDEEFAIGWIVQAYDPDAGTLRAGSAAISDLDSSSVWLAAGITGLAAGDRLIFADYGTATSAAACSQTGAGQPDHAFISATGYNPAGSKDRWG